MEAFDFIGPDDKPALLAISTAESLGYAHAALLELGYKVHSVDTHPQFLSRYNHVSYQVVVIESGFAGADLSQHPSLKMIQELSMNQRRYAVFVLIGPEFESLNALQAFSQSVHCVINNAELPMLAQLVQKVVADNNLFLTTFRETQNRVYQK